MNHWWRAYNEAVNDPKLQLLSDSLFRAWFNVMCIASANGGNLPPLKDIAFTLRIQPTKAAQVLAQLHTAGLLDKTETGFIPHNWNGRQYKSDEPKAAKGKDSYVYVIGTQWGAEALKIGFSKNPWARIVELQTAHHEKLSVLAVFKCRSHSEVDIHDILKAYRKAGEWFSLPTKIYVAISNAAGRSCTYDDLVVELRELLRSATTEADTEQKQKDSEAKASGANAPDPRARLFDEGLRKLAELTGKGADSCRSFVGQCLKVAKDDASVVLGVIDDAHRNRVADAGAWIMARLRAKPVDRPAEVDWDAVLSAYKKTGHWSRFAGNDPSSPGCRAPPELLHKYGLRTMQ